MANPGRSGAFELTKRAYLDEVAALQPGPSFEAVGARVDPQGRGIVVPLLGDYVVVGPGGVVDSGGREVDHSMLVVACRYLIMAPPAPVETGTEWVAYREFKDAAPFVGGFFRNAEQPIARAFAGRASMLEAACGALGAVPPPEGFGAQVARRFDVLARLPMLMLWNDEDEEFGASCSLLFERRASRYLDMECLAIAGWMLADRLIALAGLAPPAPLAPSAG